MARLFWMTQTCREGTKRWSYYNKSTPVERRWSFQIQFLRKIQRRVTLGNILWITCVHKKRNKKRNKKKKQKKTCQTHRLVESILNRFSLLAWSTAMDNSYKLREISVTEYVTPNYFFYVTRSNFVSQFFFVARQGAGGIFLVKQWVMDLSSKRILRQMELRKVYHHVNEMEISCSIWKLPF